MSSAASPDNPSASSTNDRLPLETLTRTSVTDFRTNLTEIVERIRESDEAVLVESNQTPEVVMLSWSTYRRLNQAVDLDTL